MNKQKMTIARYATVACLLASFGVIATMSRPALAENKLFSQQVANIDKNQPLLLQADTVKQDSKSNTVEAEGNVEIYYNGYALFADKVLYDRAKNTLEVRGNVRIKEPNGSVVNADRMTLSDDLKEGFVNSIKMVTAEDVRFAAESATHTDANTTVLKKARFTPCKPCKERGNTPLWEVKAGKITHDKANKQIYFEDATLEFLGVPLAWVPYWSTPDPTVKRRSGFLVPKYSYSDHYGSAVEASYFFNLAPNYDFTFSPITTQKQGVLWMGEWRHRLSNGSYSIKAAGIDEQNPDPLAPTTDFRGTIETKGHFALNDWWSTGWDVITESDDTFRRLYKFDSSITTNRASKAYLIGQSDRNYFEANIYKFTALSSEDSPRVESFAHPVIDYNYIFKDPVVGGELKLDMNTLAMTREDGADTNRLISEMKWRRTFIDSIGQTFTPFASVRGDLYLVDDNQVNPINLQEGDKEFIARASGAAGMTYSYPFISHTNHGSYIFEPIVQGIARPDIKDQGDIPNEDAQSLVFDDTLLFDTDKFSGYDRIETGSRMNVGMRLTAQFNNGSYARLTLGQSIHLGGDNSFEQGTGLDTTRSDYVAGLTVEPNSNLTLLAQARFDEHDFSLERTDLFMRAGFGPLETTVNYANVAPGQLGITERREEILAGASLKITDYWALFGSVRYDLSNVDDGLIEDTLGLKYSDECFVLSVSYSESFIQDRDIDYDRTVRVQFDLKHLGGTDFNYNVRDDMMAKAAQ